MKIFLALPALWILVSRLAEAENELCDKDKYGYMDGSATINLSLACNNTHLLSTVSIHAERPSSYYAYFFGIECLYVNNSQTEMIILHDAVHFPSEHSFSHVTTLMLSYGWECVLFGCYNEINSEHGHYAVNQASCVIDEDECLTGSHRCSDWAYCVDMIGGYNCSCWHGYGGDGYNCTDVNECEGGHNCSDHAQCRNIHGSYQCACLDGYEGDGYNCTDKDECSTKTVFCGPNSTCSNVIGSYECLCSKGFIYAQNQCKDIDECENDDHECGENSVCQNSPGGYSCTCKVDYMGDGYNCTASVQTSKLSFLAVPFSVVVVCVVAFFISAFVLRSSKSTKKQWWLYTYGTTLRKQELDQDFRPVDPEPSILLSGSLVSIIEPLQKQCDLVVMRPGTTTDTLQQEAHRSCSPVEQKSQQQVWQDSEGDSNSTVTPATLPDFHCELSEFHLTISVCDGCTSSTSVDARPSLCQGDESGFISDTSSSQYLSFYKLSHQM